MKQISIQLNQNVERWVVFGHKCISTRRSGASYITIGLGSPPKSVQFVYHLASGEGRSGEGRGTTSIRLRRTSSGGAMVTFTCPLSSISAPSVECKMSREERSCVISSTKPSRSLGNQIMRCSSTAAGCLKSVLPSSSTDLADGEGDDARDSFVKMGDGTRSSEWPSASPVCEELPSPERSWEPDADALAKSMALTSPERTGDGTSTFGGTSSGLAGLTSTPP